MADQTVMVLTQADRDLIQRFLDEKRRTPRNTQQRGREGQTEHEEWLTPEVYIAKVAASIPALVGSADESVIGNDGDIPGYADCDLYRIVTASGVPKLRKIGTAPKRVYNLSGTVIENTPWIPVMRDKAGSWLAIGGITTAVGTGSEGEPDCGFLILDCQDVPTEPCCDSLASSAILTYKIGSLDPDTMTIFQSGTGYVGENHCVVDAHTEIFIQFALTCSLGSSRWVMDFIVGVYVDSILDNFVDWSKTFAFNEADPEGYVTCDPFSLHYEALNTSGQTSGSSSNPLDCGTGSDAMSYPFTDAGGLKVTLDAVE